MHASWQAVMCHTFVLLTYSDEYFIAEPVQFFYFFIFFYST